jgi:hypothetical protein
MWISKVTIKLYVNICDKKMVTYTDIRYFDILTIINIFLSVTTKHPHVENEAKSVLGESLHLGQTKGEVVG